MIAHMCTLVSCYTGMFTVPHHLPLEWLKVWRYGQYPAIGMIKKLSQLYKRNRANMIEIFPMMIRSLR